MQVKEIMTYNAETINTDATLQQAAQKMKTREIGCLPVCEGQEVVGMITDRDITVRASAEDRESSTTLVQEIMTQEVFYCFEDDDLHEAAEMMEDKSIHRLLVLSNYNKPIGFVSLADFAVKSRDERLAWEILEKISEPACPHR